MTWICGAALFVLFPLRAQTPQENVRVTDASLGFTFQAETSIVLGKDGRIFAGWKEMDEINGYNRVGFGRSLDGGLTWAKTLMEVLQPTQLQSDPWLTIDESDRIYFSRTGDPGVMLSRSDDGGLTWGSLANVHDQPNSADKSSIKSDGNGTIYATYVNYGPDAPLNMKIIVRSSVDGGVTWSPGKIVVSGLNPWAPVMATRPNGTVTVVWWAPVSASRPGGNIRASTSTDRGETWGPPVQVNSVSGSAFFNGNVQPIRIPYPSATADSSGRVFVAWADTTKGNYNIVVARSDDGGATWSNPVQVNDSNTGDHWTAALTVDANDVLHAAWYDSRTGNINVFYANSADGGKTWSPNVRITTQETSASIQSQGEYIGLAADKNGAAYMVWADGRDGGLDVYFARTPGIPPSVSLSSTSLNFGSQPVGTASAAQTVTLTNSGTSALTISSISATGDFAQINSCDGSFAPVTGCVIRVTFTPTSVGTRTGLLSISDSAAGSPQTVALTGTGVSGNPVPAIALLSPATVPPGSAGFTITVNGTNFISSSVVQWNGTDLPTTFVSSTELTATISAADIASPGSAQVTVFNPAPGGGVSNALTFNITSAASTPIPAGAVQTIVPHSAFGGGWITRLFVVNLTNALNTVIINRMDQNGSVVESDATTLGPAAMLQMADSESERSLPLTINWFAIASQAPVIASVLFDFQGAAVTQPVNFNTAVGALASPPLTALTALARVTSPGGDLGLAMANLNNSSNTVTVKLFDEGGNLVAQDSLILGPFAQTAFDLTQDAAFKNILQSTSEFVGTIEVTTSDPTKPVSALVVGANLNQLFSLPVVSGVEK